MPNYGFAIDLRKCIGCHACTIACKAEHQIPIGVNRCWVKTVEKGTFPDTRRFFFPVLCNQCDEAPCVRICPTNALFKRRDGIVDLSADSCIGCRACMIACPYDQLFIDPQTRTAEKCNFCANRVENRLLPSCVSVCPTECRIFGDLDDPTSEVARLHQSESITVRKPEKGTIPKVLYIGAEQAAIQPEIAVRPFFYKEGEVSLRPLASPEEDASRPGEPRVDYDVPHIKAWGVHMAMYLLTKGIATGALFLSAILWLIGYRETLTLFVGPMIALIFILFTSVILIADLERPERFFYILTRPNWRSWMVWGSWFLMGHGAAATLWIAAALWGSNSAFTLIAGPTMLVAVLATVYTGFLFNQGLARDLWQGPQSALDLLAQAAMEGAAAMLIGGLVLNASHEVVSVLVNVLLGAIGAHLVLLAFETLLSPSPTRHHEMAIGAIRRGAFARVFWGGAILAGGVVPVVLLGGSSDMTAVALGSVLSLGGAFAWEYVWVEAGQSVPLS